ncbi:MAG: acyl carrier protein [Oscillospiraceae bacterium]|jgi:acyl carrier protein|nr:acyl carrier protein [Oscillospiraceae bacterium]
MIFERVQKIICDQFEADLSSVTEATTLDDINADSLDLYDLAMSLEEEFEVEFPEDAIKRFHTVGDIVNFIEEN